MPARLYRLVPAGAGNANYREPPWSRVVDEDVLKRWMSLELGSVHDGLVPSAIPLSALLSMDEPVAQTKGGDAHRFDEDALAAVAAAVPEELHDRLKLPISVYLDRDAKGNVYVKDEAAIAALKALGEVDREPRDGKLWMGRALAVDLAKRYPSLVQFVLH